MPDHSCSRGLQTRRDVAKHDGRDLRSRRTRRAIWTAFVDLLSERNVGAVTVTDICARALVHRVTFYKHFESKRDLLERGSYEIFTQLASTLESPKSAVAQTRRGIAPSNFVFLFDFVEKHRTVLRVLLSSDGGSVFRRTLRDFLARTAVQRLSILNGEDEGSDNTFQSDAKRRGHELAGIASAGTVLAVVEWWILAVDPPSKDRMALWLAEVLFKGFAAVSDLDE